MNTNTWLYNERNIADYVIVMYTLRLMGDYIVNE